MLRSVHAYGHAARAAELQALAKATAGIATLTHHQWRQGWLIKQLSILEQIGERLYLSPKTIEKHIEHLMDKMGVPSRVEVAAAGQAAGVTPYVAA